MTMLDKIIWVLNHDIILIGCFLGLMCGAVIRIFMVIINKIVEVWDEKKRTRRTERKNM